MSSGKDHISTNERPLYLLVTLVSVLATVIAVLGQNTFIGVYVDEFLHQMQVSYFNFSLILMVATMLSSLLVKRSSKSLDRTGFSQTILLVSLIGAGSLITLAYLPEIIRRVSFPLSARFVWPFDRPIFYQTCTRVFFKFTSCDYGVVYDESCKIPFSKPA
ncbi:MAG: hypothetical protein ACOH5I_08055 [Oligoflexus sp.]